MHVFTLGHHGEVTTDRPMEVAYADQLCLEETRTFIDRTVVEGVMGSVALRTVVLRTPTKTPF